MKKLTFKHQLLMFVGSTWLLMGCTNAEYDFNKVDYTLGFGGNEITLPSNNSTAEIQLDDLLKIGNSDLLKIDENTGDYLLNKKPDQAIAPVKVNINPITIAADNHLGLSYDINLPADIPSQFIGQRIKLPYSTTIYGQEINIPVISAGGDISLLDYEFDAPAEIKSLDYVDLGLNGQGADLVLNLSIPSSINKLQSLRVDMPDALVMTCETLPDNFDSEKNVLELKDFEIGGSLSIKFNVTRIKNDGVSVKLENGKFQIKAKIALSIEISELTIPSSSTMQVSGDAYFSDFIISGGRGVFDPEIKLDDIGSVRINSIPEFLTAKEVVADIDNPQIWLTITSTMPLGGTILAQLASDTYTTPIQLSPIWVSASTDGNTPAVTSVLICRHRPDNLPDNYQVIENDNLSKLIETLREGMQIRFTVNNVKASSDPAVVMLGHQYQLTPEYEFSCPLAFGENAVVVYSDEEKDWHKDIDMLQLSDGAYVHLDANAVNKIPADLQLSIIPLGLNGKELPENILKVELIRDQVSGTTGEAVSSPIEAKISGDISQLDGVIFKLTAKSNAALRGVTLNRKKQTLQLKDLKVKIVGKVIYDAN